MTITEFLAARLDEEEAATLAATPGPWRHNPDKHWRRPHSAEFEESVFAGPAGAAATSVAGTGPSDDLQSMADAAHIARWDPARVLREVQAKRTVVDLHTCSCSVDCGDCGACSGDHHADPTPAPCDTLRHMAAVHADHPDYQQKWAPDFP